MTSDVSDGQQRLEVRQDFGVHHLCICFRGLSVQTGPSAFRVSRVLLASEGTTEPPDVKGRGDLQALLAAQETRATLERTVQG